MAGEQQLGEALLPVRHRQQQRRGASRILPAKPARQQRGRPARCTAQATGAAGDTCDGIATIQKTEGKLSQFFS